MLVDRSNGAAALVLIGVVDGGDVPLDVLRDNVKRYIAAARGG